MSKPPIIDRDFAEKFLTAADRPFDYSVYFLFHDWWAEADQGAIDAYSEHLYRLEGVQPFLDERHIAEQVTLDDVKDCDPGTLGHGYHSFIVDNGLEANLATNYHQMNEKLQASGMLDRLPPDLSYTIVRGFQLHDFMHVLTGFSSKPMGELAQAGFHYAQMRFPYHAMRMAVTTAHMAFVAPQYTVPIMDAVTAGWTLGRHSKNLHFVRWEERLNESIQDLRDEFAMAGADAGRH